MALQKNRLEIIINGESVAYNLTPSEVEIYTKAEEIINKRIKEFRDNPRSSYYTPTQFLKIIMLELVVDSIKKDMENYETLDALDEINSQLDNYLKQIKLV